MRRRTRPDPRGGGVEPRFDPGAVYAVRRRRPDRAPRPGYGALKLVSDRRRYARWATENDLVAHGRAPEPDPGGKLLSSRRNLRQSGGTLRLAAMSLGRNHALDAFYRRLAARAGGQGDHRDWPQARHSGVSHAPGPYRERMAADYDQQQRFLRGLYGVPHLRQDWSRHVDAAVYGNEESIHPRSGSGPCTGRP